MYPDKIGIKLAQFSPQVGGGKLGAKGLAPPFAEEAGHLARETDGVDPCCRDVGTDGLGAAAAENTHETGWIKKPQLAVGTERIGEGFLNRFVIGCKRTGDERDPRHGFQLAAVGPGLRTMANNRGENMPGNSLLSAFSGHDTVSNRRNSFVCL